MSHLMLVKDDGKLVGFTDKCQRAWAKFKKKLEGLGQGELIEFSHWFPRNPALHRLHFGVIKSLLDSQEQFDDLDQLRKWLYVGAGYADFLPGPSGKMVAIPRSIAFDRIDDEDFSQLHFKIVEFMRGHHCQRFLWPHLSPQQAGEMVETIVQSFEQTA